MVFLTDCTYGVDYYKDKPGVIAWKDHANQDPSRMKSWGFPCHKPDTENNYNWPHCAYTALGNCMSSIHDWTLCEEPFHDDFDHSVKERKIYYMALATQLMLPDDAYVIERTSRYNVAFGRSKVYINDADIYENGTWVRDAVPHNCPHRQGTMWGHATASHPYLRYRDKFLKSHTLAIQDDMLRRGYCTNQEGPFSTPRLPIVPADKQDSHNLLRPNSYWKLYSRLAEPEHTIGESPFCRVARRKENARLIHARHQMNRLWRSASERDWVRRTTDVCDTLPVTEIMRQCHQIFSPMFCLTCFSNKHDTAFCAFQCVYCGGTTHSFRACPMSEHSATLANFNNIDNWDKYTIAATHCLTHTACCLAVPDTIANYDKFLRQNASSNDVIQNGINMEYTTTTPAKFIFQ